MIGGSCYPKQRNAVGPAPAFTASQVWTDGEGPLWVNSRRLVVDPVLVSHGRTQLPQRQEVWTIRVRLQLEERKRDLAMFNLAIDSKQQIGGKLPPLRSFSPSTMRQHESI